MLQPLKAISMPAETISSYSEGRDNNFNLIRIIAATLVIYTHAFGLTGSGKLEPLKANFDVSFGSWAVSVFFVASGFLITKSWDKQPSVGRFLWARFTRIYPALWICVLVCVFGVGLYFTTLPWRDFLTHKDTLKFMVANSTILPFGIFPSLPATFAGQGDGNVNFSLWTLPYELKMYLALLVLGKLRWLKVPGLVLATVVVSFAIYAWTTATGATETPLGSYSRFVFFFFAGTFFYLHQHRIPLNGWLALSLLVLTFGVLLTDVMVVRTMVLALTTPYLVMYCAYVPAGLIRTYNRLGDYSYGLYIYGAPAQHVVLALAGGSMSVGANFSTSFAMAGLLSVLSWHLIERRALKAGATASANWISKKQTAPTKT